MAVTQVYTAVPNDVITAARWNNEFGNIYNNGTALTFPLTAAVSFNGFTITLDSSGVTTLTSTGSLGFSLTPGAKTGTPGTTGDALNITANTFTDSNTAGSGTAAAFTSVSIQRPTLAATNTLVVTTDAATLYIANSPLAGTNETITNPWALWVDDGNVRLDGGLQLSSSLLVGSILACKPIGGLIQSNAAGDPTNDITISAGEAVSDDATLASRRLMVLASALTKQLDAAWAVGDANGGLDAGAIGNNDYYIWLIQRADTGVVDALFSLSSTAPTMPTSYAFKRLIGWIKRVGGAIVLFTAYELDGGGLEVLWTTTTLDVNLAATLTTSRRTDAVKVPLNFSTIVNINATFQDTSGSNFIHICSPDHTDAAPSLTVAPLANMGINDPGVANSNVLANLHVRTSATGTIATRASIATIDQYQVVTNGFTWARRN